MGNLSYKYIHKSDKNLLYKISKGKSAIDEDFTFNDRRGEICFGLNEKDKPPTLCCPRPNILVKRKRNGVTYIEDESFDDSMNVVLKEISFDKIYEAMFNKAITFEFDYSKA